MFKNYSYARIKDKHNWLANKGGHHKGWKSHKRQVIRKTEECSLYSMVAREHKKQISTQQHGHGDESIKVCEQLVV